MAMYGTVTATERLSPSMIRVVLAGPGLADFEPTSSTDQYVNALFVPDAAPYRAPFDPDEVRRLPAEQRPRGRRLTVRRWDGEAGRLTLDIVTHGDVGYAGRWAQLARPGDTLQLVGPSGGYRPNPDAVACLLAGDESALPAIGASLEAMSPGVRPIVRVVVDSPHEEIELPERADVDLLWLHRCRAAVPENLLVDAVRAVDWPQGDVDVFVHGEAGETRAVRKFLFEERGVSKDRSSISPYWRRDHTDETWRAVKAAWLAEQEAELDLEAASLS